MTLSSASSDCEFNALCWSREPATLCELMTGAPWKPFRRCDVRVAGNIVDIVQRTNKLDLPRHVFWTCLDSFLKLDLSWSIRAAVKVVSELIPSANTDTPLSGKDANQWNVWPQKNARNSVCSFKAVEEESVKEFACWLENLWRGIYIPSTVALVVILGEAEKKIRFWSSSYIPGYLSKGGALSHQEVSRVCWRHNMSLILAV